MPRFDGTGPRGLGPMTGRGEGYCVLEIPDSGQAPRGYVGLQGTPVHLEAQATALMPTRRLVGRVRPTRRCGRGRRRGRRWR